MHFFSAWPRLSKRLKGRPQLFLFDIDGTLAPIAHKPKAMRVPERIRAALKKLGQRPGTAVAVISGRSLGDAAKKVNVKGLIYSGNHGLEIKGAGIRFIHSQANVLARRLVRIVPVIKKALRNIPGVVVEEKGLTMSIHYRLVAPKDRARFRKVIKEVEPVMHKNNFEFHDGKMVVEARPSVEWDKGAALWFIRNHLHPTPATFYIGDDITDEAAFKRSDIGVRVGRKQGSKAKFYVRDQKEVEKLLSELNRL